MSGLAYRAARHFGVHDKPRTGFKVGREGYLMVVKTSNALALLHYDEETPTHGTFIPLTDRQRDILIAALQDAA